MEPLHMLAAGRLRLHNIWRSPASLCRIVSAFLAVSLIALALPGCSTITTGEEESAEPVGQIIPARIAIVHTGLVAGHFEKGAQSLGIASACHIAHGLEEQGYDVLMLDSGGSLLGTDLVDLNDGESAIGFLNAAGYDALTLGACELSLGGSLIARRSSQADCTLLTATVSKAADASPVGSASTTVKLSDGRMVGIFGITGPQVADKLDARATQEFTFCDADMTVQVAQQQVQELKEQGCMLTVCLANLPAGDGLLSARDIAEQVEGLDVMLNAGSDTTTHETIDHDSGTSTLVVETAGGLAEASVIVWEHDVLAARSYTADYHDVDEQVDALVSQSAQEQQRWLREQVATAEKELSNSDSRSKESGLGDLAADAALWESRHAGVKATPDAALVDGASLRSTLPASTLTREAILAVCPHTATRLYQIQLSGQELLDVLSRAVGNAAGSSDDFPQLAGISLTVTQKEGDGSPKFEIATVGSHKFSLTETYTVIVTERIATGAGAYASLLDNEATPLETSAGKGLINYLTHECKGKVPNAYEKPQGRLTIKKEKPEAAPAPK